MPSVTPHIQFWWVHIQTTLPVCQYYFGPFETVEEAQAHQWGFVADLVQEQASEIVVNITCCQPEMLTLYEDDDLDFRGRLQALPLYDRPTVLCHD